MHLPLDAVGNILCRLARGSQGALPRSPRCLLTADRATVDGGDDGRPRQLMVGAGLKPGLSMQQSLCLRPMPCGIGAVAEKLPPATSPRGGGVSRGRYDG